MGGPSRAPLSVVLKAIQSLEVGEKFLRTQFCVLALRRLSPKFDGVDDARRAQGGLIEVPPGDFLSIRPVATMLREE
jgi:hypothetical protein